MFCMNCGQQLPEGAKFCMKCGTPQGAVSPTGTSQTETINLDSMHTFVPAMCPNCNAHMKVDPSSKVAHCDTCGTECLVQDAIKNLTVRGNVQVGNAMITVTGTDLESLLQRVEIMLGDGDFNGAFSKCDTILDSEPTNGRVYLYMLMSKLGCRKRTDLASQIVPFDDYSYYIRAMQYGTPELKAELQGYIDTINANYKEKLNNLKIGDDIFFGTSNGQRLWWTVISTKERTALIISRNNVALMPYHQTYENITWADCTLRKWLNNEFINNCFTPEEQARILPCTNVNDNNPETNTPGGVQTIDKAFLLSINEAKELFENDLARRTLVSWWLRSPGSTPKNAANVNENGMILPQGAYGVHCDFGPRVRPAMWLKFDT